MTIIPMPEPSGWIMDGGAGGTLRYQRGPISQIQSLIHSNAPVWEERDIQKYVEAYATAKVREALEESYKSAREVEEKLLQDRLQHVSGSAAANYVANRIRALIPSTPAQLG